MLKCCVLHPFYGLNGFEFIKNSIFLTKNSESMFFSLHINKIFRIL